MSEYYNAPGAPYPPQPGNGSGHGQRPPASAGISQIVVTAVLVALAFASGWFGNAFVNQDNRIPTNDKYAQAIFQAYRAIDANYVDPAAISRRKMAYAAIRAMVDSLGDTGHSRFETPEEVQQENNSLQNKPTVGIGVLLSGGGNVPLRVDEVFPGSAADGHLMPGDLIVAVDGKSITGMSIDQVRPLIRGAEGTAVTLTVQRRGVAKPFTVTLTRKPFTVPLVSSYIIPGANLADIQLTQFAEDPVNQSASTDAELRTALKAAENQHVNGIVLDLRDNPGGYLTQAVKVASEFIPAGSGHNVYIEQTRTSRQPKPVESGGLATTLPLVIIVNGNTASAAEIVTAAVAYNRPSVHVVGEHTFGTDTILEPITLADGSVLLLGTRGWLTPSGANVRATGVVPDQRVVLPDSATEITPLVAQEEHLAASQVLADDPQLAQAVKDLTP
ncbi:MAG: S41 family peptidase [Ktedonobacterales bacterium]